MKKERKPNRFKTEYIEPKFKLARKEKKKANLEFSKRNTQQSKHEVTKVKVMSEFEKDQFLIRNQEKPFVEPELSDLIKTKEKTVVIKSRKPTKVKVSKKDKPQKEIAKQKIRKEREKPISALEKRAEAILVVERKQAMDKLLSLNSKKTLKEKKARKIARVLFIRKASMDIEKKKKELQEESFKAISEMKPRLNRRVLRFELNGRIDGRKNRKKDRIIVVKHEEKAIMDTYTTKKGQTKNRYTVNKDAEVRKIVVLDNPRAVKEAPEKEKREAKTIVAKVKIKKERDKAKTVKPPKMKRRELKHKLRKLAAESHQDLLKAS